MTVLTDTNSLRRRESCLDLHRRSVDDSVGAEDHAVAGAVAGMVADGLMHPFDTISTRVKVQHDPSRYVGVASATPEKRRERRFVVAGAYFEKRAS